MLVMTITKTAEQLRQPTETKTPDKKGILKKAFGAAEQMAYAGYEVERLRAKASHAFEDGLMDAKRMVKRGRYAAEDLLEETAHRIKKEPLQSVAVTFGAGVGLGIFVGWFLTHRARNR
jgi:ElaB/YqjD/DUF883 family membrane-anchored ribosome-binding protein